AQEHAYCLCRHDPDLPFEKRVRLHRGQGIQETITTLKQMDMERVVRMNLFQNPDKKRSRSDVNCIRRVHPARLILTVLQVEAPPAGGSEASVYYKVYYNHQYQKSEAICALEPLRWGTEPSPFGVGDSLGPSGKTMQLSFALRKVKMHQLSVAFIPLDTLTPGHELVGWIPLLDPSTQAPLPNSRVLVSIQYHSSGPWTNECSEQFFFCPAPPCFLYVSIWYPTLRMKAGDVLPVKVTVRDMQKNKELTDDLRGGELELHVRHPSGNLVYFSLHKDYPDPEVGLFYIDFHPDEPGTYASMLKYNDQLLQHKLANIKVRKPRGKK
ncbi:MAG: hypothetical protein Q8P67_18335, partial [archaeon]|nr:hypothetical protein [archaeon]